MSDDERSCSSEHQKELASIVKDRRYVRARITRIYNQVTNQFDSLSEAKKTDYIDKLNDLKIKIGDLNEQFHSFADVDGDDDSILEEEEEYDDKIINSLGLLQPAVRSRTLPISELETRKLKLPSVELPVFANDKSDNLEKFLYAFESIIDKHGLSEYEKFVYLKGQLKCGPLALINSLNATEQTYAMAKDLLTKAFASPLTQQYDVIKRLTELKLGFDDDVYVYISNMRNVMSSFDTLKIDVKIVIQYFVWHSFNDKFQNQLINITNKSMPTIDEISDNIFVATDRYLKINEQFKERQAKRSHRFVPSDDRNPAGVAGAIKTNNLAVNVSNKPTKPCILCCADNKENVTHSFRDCKVYSKPLEKVHKLESLNYCSRCSFRNHNKAQCRFKFSSPCRNCGDNHLTFLCLSKESIRNTKSVTSNSACVHFVNSIVKNDNVILPSFSVDVVNDGERRKCRVLYDTGSQRNFILDKIAKELNLPAVQSNVTMSIHGFNAKKSVTTNIVSVPLVVGDCSVEILAVVVPSIDVKIHIPDLPLIARAFTDKGYNMADKDSILSDGEITNFGLVMGPDAVRVLCPSTVLFGDVTRQSAYLYSRCGVLLLGDASNMLANIEHLTINNSNVENDCGRLVDCDGSMIASDLRTSSICSGNHVYSSVVDTDLNDRKEFIQSHFQEASTEVLEDISCAYLDQHDVDDQNCKANDDVIDFVLNNTDRTTEGRLIMPLPWNPECKHLLGRNLNLSKSILQSNFRKLSRDDKLRMYDQVFKEQESQGIIERVEDIDQFVTKHPDCSFLPHMGVFRMNHESTKVRIVYLSNLCEKNSVQPNAVSHNNALLPGPCLNSKLSTALLFSRFDKEILIFDITKAFLGIQLPESDANKLMCLWYKSVETGDFSLIAYRNLRLSFGLRPSPAILMLALYRMLILDTENDDEETIKFKQLVYNNIYMDNGLVSSGSAEILESYYNKLPFIFEDYKFSLQQFATNNVELQSKIDSDEGSITNATIKFFGMQWYREIDSLGPLPINLDQAADSKRKVLASLNSVYDLLNVYGPIVNRAKLFFQKLQANKLLDWDTTLPPDLIAEWGKICKQTNATPALYVNRCIGSRNSSFTLVAFSDASAEMYGVVVYIIDNHTRNVSFVVAKSRVLGKGLANKSIPSLECQGVAFATEVLHEISTDLSGDKNISPIKITSMYVYTDSMVSLAWIRSYFVNHDKMQKKSTFVLNRLKQIRDQCSNTSVTFRYIEGRDNPADCISRHMSYRRLQKTNYLTGPKFLRELPSQPDIEVSVPAIVASEMTSVKSEIVDTSRAMVSVVSDVEPAQQLVDITKFSSLRKILNIYVNIVKFVNALKRSVQRRKDKVAAPNEMNLYARANNVLIRVEQHVCFPDVVYFFKSRNVPATKIPDLILQMNLYMDSNDIIRVKSKFTNNNHPILLDAKSYLSRLIVMDLHARLCHAGLYHTLRELRKTFWLLRGFSTVRRFLRGCVTCKRVNERPVKLSQNSYRDFRSNPGRVPFSTVFLDYIGPINVKFEDKVKKVWLLLTTCMFTRAISLQICLSADTAEFLRCLQMHIYKYGMFYFCLSDLGSQITAGTKIITDFLADDDTKNFLSSRGIEKVTFEQYAKGNSSLGSVVESCVKQTKHLIVKSIGRLILEYAEFQLLIAKVEHVINRRPVAFRELLRNTKGEYDIPDAITPEMLLHGRELLSLNIIPQMQPVYDNDDEFVPCPDNFKKFFFKARKANSELINLYHGEFLHQLISQAVDKKDRYKPVLHKQLDVGDIVLLVTPNTKQHNYPMGVVRKTNVNSLGEVSSAVVFKGGTREEVVRHASSLILLLKTDDDNRSPEPLAISDNEDIPSDVYVRPQRRAAAIAREKISALKDDYY